MALSTHTNEPPKIILAEPKQRAGSASWPLKQTKHELNQLSCVRMWARVGGADIWLQHLFTSQCAVAATNTRARYGQSSAEGGHLHVGEVMFKQRWRESAYVATCFVTGLKTAFQNQIEPITPHAHTRTCHR
jgi:hypothetical protein